MLHIANFWIWIIFTRRAYWDHCQQNWSIFTCLTPVEPKFWPLTFSSITKKWYIIDRSNYTFFLNRYNKRNLLVSFLTTLKQLLNLTPVQTILWPQASCTGCDLAVIWNSDPWTPTNIMKLSNLLFLFSWVNFASIQPTAILTTFSTSLQNTSLTRNKFPKGLQNVLHRILFFT